MSAETPLRPPTAMEAGVLAELRLLTKSLLYQQEEYPPDSPAGKSKARAQTAFDQALCAANHPEPAMRLSLWTHVIDNLIHAEFQALYARWQHFEEVQQADPEGWNWKRLEEKIDNARVAVTMIWQYWRGWQEGQGLPVPDFPLEKLTAPKTPEATELPSCLLPEAPPPV